MIIVSADERLHERGVDDLERARLRSEYDSVWLDYARVSDRAVAEAHPGHHGEEQEQGGALHDQPELAPCHLHHQETVQAAAVTFIAVTAMSINNI